MNNNSTFSATDGSDYEVVMGRWSSRLAVPFLDFAGLREGETVLDVGCGTGRLAEAVAFGSSATRVHAVDLSPEYIDFARSRIREPRIAFDVGDACSLVFPDQSFDRVLSMLLLHFVPEPARAISEMYRVAKPGAVVAACVWDVRGGYVASRIFYDTAAALDPKAQAFRAKNYTRPMTRPGELARAWQEAGFRDVREASLAIRMDFESFQDFWAPYEKREGPAAAYLDTLSGSERASILAAVRAAYLDGESDGPRSYAALAWAVRGIKPG
ncbi:MAG TPA: methyltransferase domain-containing protein [Thermoanaerobaculia bacterium]|nr:methyltransferase domain-containing protein [Thermoanaerobaculia bacterium]